MAFNPIEIYVKGDFLLDLCRQFPALFMHSSHSLSDILNNQIHKICRSWSYDGSKWKYETTHSQLSITSHWACGLTVRPAPSRAILVSATKKATAETLKALDQVMSQQLRPSFIDLLWLPTLQSKKGQLLVNWYNNFWLWMSMLKNNK